MTQVVQITEYKPWENFLLFNSFQTDLQIFTGSDRISFYVVRKDPEDFHVVLKDRQPWLRERPFSKALDLISPAA